jgi:hypothetical protein
MNIKILFKKTTLIYIIIVLSLAILFNNSKKSNYKTYIQTEGFNSEEDIQNKEKQLELLIPIYEEEKNKYKLMFKNGEEIFNSIIDISNINIETIDTLIQPSELEELAINIQTDITTIVNKIFTTFEKIAITDVDKYLSEDGEYILLQKKIIEKYSSMYSELENLIKEEINTLLLDKIDNKLSNNSSNYKIEDTKLNTNTTNSGNNGFLSGLNNKLSSKTKDIDNAEKIIELKRKFTYIRNKIAPSDEANEDELKKIVESFYEPISTMSSSPESTIPSNPLMTTETTLTRPMQRIPKSFDGFTSEELEIIKRNQLANTPKNIDTVLIDPLKAVETVQEDLLGLLETFNDSNNKKSKSEYLNRQFDPTNRGSYLINSPTDEFTTNKINNLSNYSKPSSYSKRILSPKEKILETLSNKEYRTIDNQLVKENTTDIIKEGFENKNNDKVEKKTEILSLFDGFIRYSSTIISGLINKLTSSNTDINSMDNNKMQSYGIIIIAIAILLFFISSSS